MSIEETTPDTSPDTSVSAPQTAASVARLKERLAPDHIKHYFQVKRHEIALILFERILADDDWYMAQLEDNTAPAVLLDISDLLEKYTSSYGKAEGDDLLNKACSALALSIAEQGNGFQTFLKGGTDLKTGKSLMRLAFLDQKTPEESKTAITDKTREIRRHIRANCHEVDDAHGFWRQ